MDFEVEIRKGVRYIDGKTVDEFLKTLTTSQQLELAMLGQMVTAKKIKTSPITAYEAIKKSKESN